MTWRTGRNGGKRGTESCMAAVWRSGSIGVSVRLARGLVFFPGSGSFERGQEMLGE